MSKIEEEQFRSSFLYILHKFNMYILYKMSIDKVRIF